MQAMIFAAGMGTRLKPLTDTMPKALVRVGGEPLLRRVVENLAGAGVDRIVVNVHHFASQITDYLKLNRNFGQTQYSSHLIVLLYLQKLKLLWILKLLG